MAECFGLIGYLITWFFDIHPESNHSINSIITGLKNNGYEVHVHMNDLDPNKAAGRNMQRLAVDGRFLDLQKTSYKYGNEPNNVFNRLVKEGNIDGYTKVSNDVRKGENPVQLAGTEDIDFEWKNTSRRENALGGNGRDNGSLRPENGGYVIQTGTGEAQPVGAFQTPEGLNTTNEGVRPINNIGAGETAEQIATPQTVEAFTNAKRPYKPETVEMANDTIYSLRALVDQTEEELTEKGLTKKATENITNLRKTLDDLETGIAEGLRGKDLDKLLEDYKTYYNRLNGNARYKGIYTLENTKYILGSNTEYNLDNLFKKEIGDLPEDENGFIDLSGIDTSDLPFNDDFTINPNPRTAAPEVEIPEAPKADIPNAGANPNLKVSQAYDNTLTNSGLLTDQELKDHTDRNRFTYISHQEEETMEAGAKMRRDEGENFIPNRLEKEGFTASDVDGMMQAYRDKIAEARAADKAGQETTELWEDANIIFRKIQQESSRNAAAMQALAKWSRNTPEGMLSEAEHIVNQVINPNRNINDITKGLNNPKPSGTIDSLGAENSQSGLRVTRDLKNTINKGLDKKAVKKQEKLLKRFPDKKAPISVFI